MTKKDPKDIENLSKYEVTLKKEITNLMNIEKVKFPAVLHAYTKGKNNYKDKNENENNDPLKILKSEHMKYRRSSFSMEEVSYILDEFGWEIIYTCNGKPIELSDYVVTINDVKPRIRFTDFMIVCDLFNIDMKWRKRADRTVKAKMED